MKTQKNQAGTSWELSESIEKISNDLLFHPHPVLEKIWMDTKEVCELLGVSRRALYTYRKKGLITCRFVHGVDMYPAGEVEVLMKYVMMKKW